MTENSILSNFTKNSHTINSKFVSNGKVCIIFNYNYFLNKRDLRTLLRQFDKIILCKGNTFLKDLPLRIQNLEGNQKLDLLMILDDEALEVINNKLELEIELRNHLEVKLETFESFCEVYLRKCYIPNDISYSNLELTELLHFRPSILLMKKVVDIVIGLTLWLFTQPLWLMSLIMIYFQSRGPVFFKQKRIGLGGKEFKVVKFRSMKLNAEKDGARFAEKNDERIFPFGKFMRKSRIDELPQLLNILFGEVTLIGPRPERKVWIESFEEGIPYYDKRHLVKPGISGYAQVMYPYGAGIDDARHKLMYDLFYIKNWTFKLEFEIILRTIWTIVYRRGI